MKYYRLSNYTQVTYYRKLKDKLEFTVFGIEWFASIYSTIKDLSLETKSIYNDTKIIKLTEEEFLKELTIKELEK